MIIIIIISYQNEMDLVVDFRKWWTSLVLRCCLSQSIFCKQEKVWERCGDLWTSFVLATILCAATLDWMWYNEKFVIDSVFFFTKMFYKEMEKLCSYLPCGKLMKKWNLRSILRDEIFFQPLLVEYKKLCEKFIWQSWME